MQSKRFFRSMLVFTLFVFVWQLFCFVMLGHYVEHETWGLVALWVFLSVLAVIYEFLMIVITHGSWDEIKETFGHGG